MQNRMKGCDVMNYKTFIDKTFNCKFMDEVKDCYYSKKINNRIQGYVAYACGCKFNYISEYKNGYDSVSEYICPANCKHLTNS